MARLRDPRFIVMIIVALAAIAMLAAPASTNAARLVWNESPSAPAGVYWIERKSWRVGDRVAVQPSPELAGMLDELGVLKRGRLLIKTVAAAEGDRVCRDGEAVTVNGRLAATARATMPAGEALPSWEGCRPLTAGDVFLLGETDGSFDGRYFGMTGSAEIRGPVRLLLHTE